MRNDPLPLNDPGGLGIFAVMARALAPPPFQPAAPRRGLMERLENWFWTQRQRDIEAYLAQATDLHDLEARIRDLERNRIHPYY